jgi:hypothetical protein
MVRPFPDFLEARLNSGNSTKRFEVANFGVAGFSLVQQLAMLEDRALQFQPDAVFITDSPRADFPIQSAFAEFYCCRTYNPLSGTADAVVRATGVYSVANKGLPISIRNSAKHLWSCRCKNEDAMGRKQIDDCATSTKT